ncbi:MAG: glycosyltransferase family 4 protein [Myxococcota bacterium]|jgi:UDP-glucose:(heptosyl)LPS alpha-1,3-glucosyltransferase|nr:glycosyltransferase family 4 protein [Myxococcota bacterium]
MRVALVIERFENAAGGGEQVAWNVARELVRAGDDVHVLCREGADAPGVRVHRLGAPRFWQPVRVTTFAHRVGRELTREHYDVVHAFSKAYGPDVFHVGGGSHADFMEKTYGARGARWRRLSPRHRTLLSLERKMFETPDLIGQCVSHQVRREIAARYGIDESRLPVIPCGVDTARFAPENQGDARDEVRCEFGLGDETVWLFVGSGWRRKGLDIALDALAKCADSRALLWVAGKDDPASWRALAKRRGIEDRVRFLAERKDVERLYAACDGLLFPSRYDAFGLVCLEAAAAERAVVVSADAGASELFEDCGRVIQRAGDPTEYARAMNDLSNPQTRSDLASRARSMAAEHDWSGHVARLRDLYAEVQR